MMNDYAKHQKILQEKHSPDTAALMTDLLFSLITYWRMVSMGNNLLDVHRGPVNYVMGDVDVPYLCWYHNLVKFVVCVYFCYKYFQTFVGLFKLSKKLFWWVLSGLGKVCGFVRSSVRDCLDCLLQKYKKYKNSKNKRNLVYYKNKNLMQFYGIVPPVNSSPVNSSPGFILVLEKFVYALVIIGCVLCYILRQFDNVSEYIKYVLSAYCLSLINLVFLSLV